MKRNQKGTHGRGLDLEKLVQGGQADFSTALAVIGLCVRREHVHDLQHPLAVDIVVTKEIFDACGVIETSVKKQVNHRSKKKKRKGLICS